VDLDEGHLEEAVEQIVHRLGADSLGKRSGACDVATENGYLLALALGYCGDCTRLRLSRSSDRRAALAAEALAVLDGRGASGACVSQPRPAPSTETGPFGVARLADGAGCHAVLGSRRLSPAIVVPPAALRNALQAGRVGLALVSARWRWRG
jgi:hypothetical protein